VGVTFFAPVQTGPKVHPASYTMGSWSFQWVRQLGHGTDQPTPSSAMVQERVELYLHSPSEPLWPLLGWNLPLPLPSNRGKLQQQYVKCSGQLLVTMWWGEHTLLSGFLNKNVGKPQLKIVSVQVIPTLVSQIKPRRKTEPLMKTGEVQFWRLLAA